MSAANWLQLAVLVAAIAPRLVHRSLSGTLARRASADVLVVH